MLLPRLCAAASTQPNEKKSTGRPSCLLRGGQPVGDFFWKTALLTPDFHTKKISTFCAVCCSVLSVVFCLLCVVFCCLCLESWFTILFIFLNHVHLSWYRRLRRGNSSSVSYCLSFCVDSVCKVCRLFMCVMWCILCCCCAVCALWVRKRSVPFTSSVLKSNRRETLHFLHKTMK